LAGTFNVSMLVLLASAHQQDYELISVSPEIHAVPWAKIQSQLHHSGSHALWAAQIAFA